MHYRWILEKAVQLLKTYIWILQLDGRDYYELEEALEVLESHLGD